MDLLVLRDRIRTTAQSVGLTYSEIELLDNVNELLNQTMPCLMWIWNAENNTYSENTTETEIDLYLFTNFFDSQKIETGTYERDFIITEKNELRKKYIAFISALQFECDGNFIQIVRDTQIPLAERISIEGFLTHNARLTIRTNRDYCLEVEEC